MENIINPINPSLDEMLEIEAVLQDLLNDEPVNEAVPVKSASPEKGDSMVDINAHLRGGHNFFVPHVRDPRNEEEILMRISEGPVAMAIMGGGELTLRGRTIKIPRLKLTDVRVVRVGFELNSRCFNDSNFAPIAFGKPFNDPEIKALRKELGPQGVVVQGVALQLPNWLARAQAAFEATVCGAPYNWNVFFQSYRRDLAAAAAKIIDRTVMNRRMRGFQAHACDDPRLGVNQVGVSVKDGKKLAKMLGVKSIHGMTVVLGRYPSAGKRSFRWVTLVVLEDVPSHFVYVNADAWQKLHGGDFDGDLGYILFDDGDPRYLPVEPLGKMPKLRITKSDPLADLLMKSYTPLDDEKELNLVGGMMIKYLTGSLTHTFWVLARSAGVSYATRSIGPATDPKFITMSQEERLRRAYEGVFDVFFPVMEGTMDARKESGKEIALRQVARALTNSLNGSVLDTEPFGAFLGDDLARRFRGMVQLASGVEGNLASLQVCRNTAFGRLLAAGDNMDRAVDKLIATMLRKGWEADMILPALQDDAKGKRFIDLTRKGGGSDEEPQPGEVLPDPFAIAQVPTTIAELFETITYEDKPVFKVVGVERPTSGMYNVTVIMSPHWLGTGITTYRVPVCLPDPVLEPSTDRVQTMRLLSPEGHVLVQFPWCKPRMFRPRFRMMDGALHIEQLAEFLQRQLLEACRQMPGVLAGASEKVRGGKLTIEKVEAILNETVMEEVMKLPISECPEERLIQQFEYEIKIEETRDTVESWDRYDEVLRAIQARGDMDIVSTSKGKPGTICYKKGKYGVPSYLIAINPFGKYLDAKRRVEPREIRQREKLYWEDGKPLPLTIQAKGTQIPEALAVGVRELVCMIADTNYNTWESEGEVECVDALRITQSALEKMTLAEIDFRCEDLDAVADLVEHLVSEGYSRGQIQVDERTDGLGGGLHQKHYVVKLAGPIQDLGKVKACVGPVKGVMLLLPNVRLFARYPNGLREIDMIVPWTTVSKKKAVDFWLYTAREAVAHVGGTRVEIDPAQPLEEMILEAQLGLEETFGNAEGHVEVVAAYDRGGVLEFETLGTALVGAVPFFRPSQTAVSTAKVRKGKNLLNLESHALIMAQVDYKLHRSETEEFVEIVEALQATAAACAELPEGTEVETVA